MSVWLFGERGKAIGVEPVAAGSASTTAKMHCAARFGARRTRTGHERCGVIPAGDRPGRLLHSRGARGHM